MNEHIDRLERAVNRVRLEAVAAVGSMPDGAGARLLRAVQELARVMQEVAADVRQCQGPALP